MLHRRSLLGRTVGALVLAPLARVFGKKTDTSKPTDVSGDSRHDPWVDGWTAEDLQSNCSFSFKVSSSVTLIEPRKS
jgi:hypothetical protein